MRGIPVYRRCDAEAQDITHTADDRLHTYLSGYYNPPAEVIRRRQGCYAGELAGATAWLRGFVEAGATHFALRFIGDHERDMEALAGMREELES